MKAVLVALLGIELGILAIVLSFHFGGHDQYSAVLVLIAAVAISVALDRMR